MKEGMEEGMRERRNVRRNERKNKVRKVTWNGKGNEIRLGKRLNGR